MNLIVTVVFVVVAFVISEILGLCGNRQNHNRLNINKGKVVYEISWLG